MNGPQLYLKCEWCNCFFKYDGGRRRRWCTDAHKVAAWRKATGNESIVDQVMRKQAEALSAYKDRNPLSPI